jgi:hypothetical protein
MKKKLQHQDPPLSSFELEYLHDAAQGGYIKSKTVFWRRGFLSDMETRIEPNHTFKLQGKLWLNDLCEDLRGQLETAELPTDRSPIMPIELDYGYDPNDHGIIANEDVWVDCLRGSTDPLTKHRIAGELLHAIQRILSKLSDEQLTDVLQAMEQYALYQQAGVVNSLAVAGELAKDSRAKGPKAKNAASRKVRKLILRIAEEFWENQPNFRGHTVKTAEQIVCKVNKARAELDLGRKPLAAKTIGDHLSAALQESVKQ